jgi:hypothetical protein
MASRYRLLLVNLPSLLRDIVVDAIAENEQFEVVPSDPDQPADSLAVQPDVVLAGTISEVDELVVSALQSKWPAAQVLTLRHSSGDVELHETWRRSLHKGSLAVPEALAELLAAARRGREFSGSATP